MENKIIQYQNETGKVSVNVMFQNENFWLTQKAMAELFGVEVPAISKHLKNIFESGELNENSVVSKMEITASDGKTYNTNYYNLDAIIVVGYSVNSKEATQFRIWATNTLKEFIIKGFVLNDEMLKNGKPFGKDYSITDKGTISHFEAKLKAENEFEKYRVIQDKNYISDFDKEIKKLKK